MIKHGFVALALWVASVGVARAEPGDLGVSLGLKAWNTQWTTFGYGLGDQLIQVPSKDRVVWMPQLTVRYRDFVGSVSGYAPIRYDRDDGPGDTRKEFDANVGYLVLPNLAATLGYKKVGQRNGPTNYELGGPVAGLSASAVLSGPWSLYGSFGLGKLKATASANVRNYTARYWLTEAGLSYNLVVERWVRAVTFTAGYRNQVFDSKDLTGGQEGRDLTHGLTLGVVTTF